MNVVCIGSGYVGTVTGAAFAALGHRTTLLDIDERRIGLLASGISPIYEPGLDHLLTACIGQTLFATTDYEAVRQAEVVFIAVGTPSRPDGTAELKNIKLAAEGIGKHLNPSSYTVVVNKSTVPVGTADLVSSIIQESSGLTPDVHYSVVSNPEFLREGYALEDVFFPDRIVIGSPCEKANAVMRSLYRRLMDRANYDELSKHFLFEHRLHSKLPSYFETDIKSAEMIKYASNAFLAVKISYINEIARLCESLGANVTSVASGMGLDSRIGNKFLQVSSGWSGSCFPKDMAELLATGRKYDCELSVVAAAIQSNGYMHKYVIDRIKQKLKSLNGKKIGVLGLTFKPNTDDARHTQASYVIRELLDVGARVKAHDPQGMSMFKSLNAQMEVEYCNDAHQVAAGADALILLTHWDEYSALRWKDVLAAMRKPFVFDTRNYLDASELHRLGFDYEGIGIGSPDISKESDKLAITY